MDRKLGPNQRNVNKVKKRAGSGKTKFEEYVELDMQKGAASAEEFKWENDLAKRLNVKDGLLTGLDDNVNSLLMDTDSDFEPLEEKILTPGDADSDFEFHEEEKILEDGNFLGKTFDENSLNNKRTKRKSPGQGLTRELKAKQQRNPLDQRLEVDAEQRKETPSSMEPDGDVADEATTNRESKLFASNYVPPHLRTPAENKLESVQIRKQVRGILNRSSDVELITGELCAIFHSAGRSIGSQIISDEILASCSGGPLGDEQYAAVFAACVAGIACTVGIDFGGKMMASLAKSFEEGYMKEENLSLRNQTLLLAYLCIFGVCSSDLIYDFLNMLSKRLTEVDVSTIVTILQCCGMKLRGDDPTAMKNFILSIQNRANELKSHGDGQMNLNNKRVCLFCSDNKCATILLIFWNLKMEFMLETICDIKNNKKRSKEEPAQFARIKKWLQQLRVENILIRGVSWSKLLDPNKKGQWWWSVDEAPPKDSAKDVAGTIDREVLEAQKMLQLAAIQRMNTDTRRAIFCIIMSGEDYIDAFEKLLRLPLPGKQDREIMRVLMECCLQEKVFNKYYIFLASKLCSYDKKHKFTLQYCIWDHLKEVESMQVLRMMHLSRFVAEMLSSFTLSLSILKVVELADLSSLTPKRVMYFRMLFMALLEYPDRLVWNVFTRIAVSSDLEHLRSSIVFFMNRYVAIPSSGQAVLKKIRIAKRALNNVEGILM